MTRHRQLIILARQYKSVNISRSLFLPFLWSSAVSHAFTLFLNCVALLLFEGRGGVQAGRCIAKLVQVENVLHSNQRRQMMRK